MKKYNGRLVGILGTIMVHLVAAIIFMSFQLKSLHNELHDTVEVEYIPEETVRELLKEKQELEQQLQAQTVEKILAGDPEMLNIARNLANKADPKVSKDDYIDKVKEELIKSGKLGRDNYIDEQKRKKAAGADDIPDEEDSIRDGEDKPDRSQEMAANYKGPTRIYYDLSGRTHTYLPIPIYKCQGSGKVVLSIEVNQKGTVEKAQVMEGQSTTSDPCLVETAMNTALISRFNSDVSAPRVQTGTLTYHFVAQ